MKTPAENPEGYDDVSLVKRAKDLHGRLLIVHGTYDDNVHPQNTWAFVDALVAAGKPVDVMALAAKQLAPAVEALQDAASAVVDVSKTSAPIASG